MENEGTNKCSFSKSHASLVFDDIKNGLMSKSNLKAMPYLLLLEQGQSHPDDRLIQYFYRYFLKNIMLYRHYL